MEIFTIPLAVTLAWLKGEAGETELRIAADTARDVVFIMRLESLGDYRELWQACRAAARAGSVAMATRTANPAVRHRIERGGGKVMLTETHPDGTRHFRYFLPPEDFFHWVRVKVLPPSNLPGHLGNAAHIES